MNWYGGSQRSALVDAVWRMYEVSYARIGLHLRGPSDLYEYDPWLVFFVSGKPVAFALFKQTGYGLKLGVLGSDGSPTGKSKIVAWLATAFSQPGVYGEVSHAVERMTGHAPRVCAADAKRVLGKPIQPSADGIHYKRTIPQVGTVEKVMVGMPSHVPASVRPMCEDATASDRTERADAVSFLDETGELMMEHPMMNDVPWRRRATEKATVVETWHDVVNARPGLYVVRSGSEAYFPMMGLIEAGYADFEGERYDDHGRTVTVHVTTSPATVLAQEMRETRTITIGKSFFISALKDYSDWQIKWWREAVQNAVDAGGLNVALGAIKQDDGTMLVFCDDDGKGMDEDTIINKFLVLGGTTKTDQSGAAGGFGKAKEMLLLPWISWRIHSRDSLVEGAGDRYDITRGPMRQGTRLEVVMPPDKFTDGAIALGFLQKCYLPNVSFTVNGEPARADLAGTSLVSSVPDKAEIYYIPATSTQSYLYVRARGLFMFHKYIGEIPGFILAELIAPSIEILSANRDGFRDWDVEHSIAKLAERIAKDNLSALKSKRGMIRQKFEGTGKFRARERASAVLERIGPYGDGRMSEESTEAVVAAVGHYAQGEEERLQSMPSRSVAMVMLDQKFLGPNHLEAAVKQLVWEPDFFLVNEIDGYIVPRKFFPESMTPTVLKLAKTWVELCRYVMMQLGSEQQFGVGFVFSTDAAAQAITDEDREKRTEKWIMLNPWKDIDTRREIWRPAQDADLKWLYAAAIHECTHIADRISYHDESFAAALTRNMARCADGYRKIRQIAAGIRTRGASGGPEVDE